MYFYNGDYRKIATWCALGGTLGAAGMVTYQMYNTTVRRNTNPASELVDSTECFNMDADIRDAFINLQEYRAVNPWLFHGAVRNLDCLLFKEQSIANQSIVPNENDNIIAFTYFSVACNKLKMFQSAVDERLGKHHALIVQQFNKVIFERAEQHLIFIINSCARSKPTNTLAKVRADIASTLKQTESASFQKWDAVKRLAVKEPLS
jgi:hypothetical protein